MELLVATWTLRLAIVAAVLIGGVSLAAGVSVLDAAQRAVLAFFLFTLGGRLLLDRLEPPERKLERRRRRYARPAAKTTKRRDPATAGRG